MFKSIDSILLVCVLLFSPTSMLRADLIELFWEGTTIFDSQDNVGLFGNVGELIPAGTEYTARYVYDTSISFIDNPINSTQEVTGGSFFNPFRQSPLVNEATFTLQGNPVDMNGLYYGSYFRQSGQGVSNISTDAIAEISGNPPFDGQLFQRAIRNDDSYGLSLNLPAVLLFGAGDSTDGVFSYRTRDALGNITAITGFQLRPTSLTVSAVPEPSSFAITAISTAIGFAFRRQRSR